MKLTRGRGIPRYKRNDVDQAVIIVNGLLSDDAFWLFAINSIGPDVFHLSNDGDDGVDIYELIDVIKWYLRQDFPDVRVAGFRVGIFRRFKYRNTLAMVLPSNHNKIKLYAPNINRSVIALAATIFHELIHLIDMKHPFSFGHGGNSSTGKGDTAPYKVGTAIVKKYLTFRNLSNEGQSL